MKHRREIDGLRAFAILPVLLFHAGFGFMPGGFFGVDVFFVISGFLITGIILNELHRDGRFSIVGFYERRARRIMPALFLVIAVMYPVGWFLLFPDQWSIFCQSLVSITYFASNYFFLGKMGYFDPNIDLNPMLHTWSLAIEEQFYLFFPLILWVLYKVLKERYWIPLLSVIGIASLVWAQVNYAHDPNGTFYLLQFRAWELIAGAVAAIHLNHKSRQSYSNQTLSLLGLALILVSVFAVGNGFAHPGFITLLPVVGTVLIVLFAGEQTWVNRVLSWRLFVGIGLISYSAYLWHQPLFAFYRTSQLHTVQPVEFLPIIALTLLLAWGSYRFVENPFRDRKRFSRRQIFVGTAVLALAVVALGMVGRSNLVDRHRASLAGQNFQALSKLDDVNRGLDGACRQFAEAEPKCTVGSDPTVLLWGDSYAMHLALGLRDSTTKISFVQQTKSACNPVLGLAQQNSGYGIEFGKACIAENDKVLDWLARHKSVKYVVLASPWSTTIDESAVVYRRDGTIGKAGEQGWQALRDTVSAIKALGVKPVIVLPTATNLEDHGACAMRAIANGQRVAECNFNLTDNKRAGFSRTMGQQNLGAPLFSLDSMLCPAGTCLAEQDDVVIYRDMAHISMQGSSYLGKTYDLAGQLIKAADRG